MNAELIKQLNDQKAKLNAEITTHQVKIDELKGDLKKIDKALKALEK